MARALLLVPHFWDPVCVPLGVSSLKSYAERAGHAVELCDFNTVSSIIHAKRAYFEEGMRQFPYWKRWNIERNGTEMLATHQRNRAVVVELAGIVVAELGEIPHVLVFFGNEAMHVFRHEFEARRM